mmetsp:Transcript_4186/g.8041  ORF Transcript_4186/g.8041 Transcript_4186/m.8041 type:complete len:282 (+) Transcript_4186:36-881(+)
MSESKSATKVAFVTGANQGLGFALVKALCKELAQGSTVYMGVRSMEKGERAAEELKKIHLVCKPILCDVSKDSSVKACAEKLSSEHKNGLDILIHNAAARMYKETPKSEQVENFINTNNLGTTRMVRHFAPLMAQGSHFLIVASGFGSLTRLDKSKHALFDVSKCSLDDIDKVMLDYAEDVKLKRDVEKKWPEWINVPSKVGQVAVAKILAQDADMLKRNVLVHAVCPGLIDTAASRPWFADMSKAATPDEAAVDFTWLIQNRFKKFHGVLVKNREAWPWV